MRVLAPFFEASCRETSYHFVKTFFPSRTVSDDPEGHICETWETPFARGRPYASHQMKRTISRGGRRIKARQRALLHGRKGHPMIYIEQNLESFEHYILNSCRPKDFSLEALPHLFEWYSNMEQDWEIDLDEMAGEWSEYDDAGAMWRDFHEVDEALPIIYDPDQLESLTDAMEARGFNIIRTESGGWLIHEA